MRTHWARSAKFEATGTVAYFGTRSGTPHKAVVLARREGEVKIAVTWFPDNTRSERWVTPDVLEAWDSSHADAQSRTREAVRAAKERA